MDVRGFKSIHRAPDVTRPPKPEPNEIFLEPAKPHLDDHPRLELRSQLRGPGASEAA